MEDRIEILERRLAELEVRVETIARRSRRRLVGATMVTGLAVAWACTPEARAQFGITLTSLNVRLMAVEAKTAPITVAGTDFSISGMNVHVVDGTGSTNSTSGLGNLTVGYNALRPAFGFGGNARTGSHNLILGDQNNYSSYGGLVAGLANMISGHYSSVSGGTDNLASGDQSSVSGGAGNTASTYQSSVSGGEYNTASGFQSSVSGGAYNTASGINSSVSGGYFRSTTGEFNWAAGGYSSPQ